MFYKEEERNTTGRSGKRVGKFCTCRRAQSIPARQVAGRGAPPWFSRPGFTSSWLHSWRSAHLPEPGCLKARVCIY